MTIAPQLHSSEIRDRIAQVDLHLNDAKAKLPAVLRTAAEAYLAGEAAIAPDAVRLEIETLGDLLTGLRELAVIAEHRELNEEIVRRERQHKKDAIALDELRRKGTRGESVIEGTGPSFALALRRDREERAADFNRYAEADIAHKTEARAIAALVARRDELAMQLPD